MISVPPHSTSTGEGGVTVLISDARGPQGTCVAGAVPSPRPQACLCSDPAAFLRRAASGGAGGQGHRSLAPGGLGGQAMFQKRT